MKIILLENIKSLGKKGDLKDVAEGYALNFLLPKKFAEIATVKAIAGLEKRIQNLAIEREVQIDLLMKNLEEIKGKVIKIKSKADEKGHLFSGIHKKEIVEEMKKQHNADIDEEFIVLEKPIKEVGEFDIPILIKGKKSSFKLVVEKI